MMERKGQDSAIHKVTAGRKRNSRPRSGVCGSRTSLKDSRLVW